LVESVLKLFSKRMLVHFNNITQDILLQKEDIIYETDLSNKHVTQSDVMASFNEFLTISAVLGRYHKPLSVEESSKLGNLKNKFHDKRCFIIGNGPSLNNTDLSFLKHEFSFGVNNIFYMTERNGFRPTFYVCEAQHVIDANKEKIDTYDCEYRFFPTYFKPLLKEALSDYYFYSDMSFYMPWHPLYAVALFSDDCSKVLYQGQTVTYICLQLAYYLGFKEVYLIGVDFNYTIPKSSIIKGNVVVSTEHDANHFDNNYFGKGKKWILPQMEKQLISFAKANAVYENNGRKIYNATIGGKLELFERVNYQNIFSNSKKV